MGDLRIIAVDWSGAKTNAAKTIALAEARDGVLTRLEPATRDRRRIVDHLVELHEAGDRVIVGLDFGFSFPEWYVREQHHASAQEMWAWLARDDCADGILSRCEPPFWGRSKRPPDAHEPHRVTEYRIKDAERVNPQSVFKISGVGSVGTGSIRGMCELHRLREQGFVIWPFDDPGDATALEIYPRVFSRGVTNSAEARAGLLARLEPQVPSSFFELAKWNEHAFDAAISAIAMSLHADDLAALPRIDDPLLRLEGVIWWPGWRAAHGL